jgi:hypothetical protein
VGGHSRRQARAVRFWRNDAIGLRRTTEITSFDLGAARRSPAKVSPDQHRSAIDAGERHMSLGLASLVVGVDLVGRHNLHTVIVKLPFPIPDDPVMLAHSEWFEAGSMSPSPLFSCQPPSTSGCSRVIG